MQEKTEAIPSKIGQYEVLTKIGQGGIGEVFLVYDPVNKRQIVLKRLRVDKINSQKKRDQFLNSARYAAKLVHPAIIPIYSIVADKDFPYFTMPFIAGRTLELIFKRARECEQKGWPLPLDCSVEAFSYLFWRICQAVAFAHSQGVIHRDLKPSNIIVSSLGQVCVLDWGLIQDEEQPSRTVSGTIMYLAPEQLSGKPASWQTEIYSLGLILYEMLTLRYPFHREDLTSYYQNLYEELLLDPAKAAPHRHIPPFISEIANKCLSHSLTERYKQVEEVIQSLEANGIGVAGFWNILPDDEELDFFSYEKAFLAFPFHPLLPVLQNRLFDSLKKYSKTDRQSFYECALLAARFVPPEAFSSDAEEIMGGLFHQFNPLYFIDNQMLATWPKSIQNLALAVHLSFLLAKKEVIVQIFDVAYGLQSSPLLIMVQTLLALIHLEAYDLVHRKLEALSIGFLDIQAIVYLEGIKEALKVCMGGPLTKNFLALLAKKLKLQHLFSVFLIFDIAIKRNETKLVIETVDFLVKEHQIENEQLLRLDYYLILALLLQNDIEEAGKILKWYTDHFPKGQLEPLEFPYSCWLYLSQGISVILPEAKEGMSWWEIKLINNQRAILQQLSRP